MSRTIEGLATGEKLHPMQEAFRENHGLQCGFCTPGMIMTAVDIVNRKGHELDEQTIREELEGNLCRCTGYHNIVKAIAAGAKAMGGAPRSRRPSSAARREYLAAEGGRLMNATGIGAAVRRKEDLRFITGKGQLHRRHQSSRPVLCAFSALAARPCEDQDRSTRRRRRHARRARGPHRRRPRRRQDRRAHLRLDDPFQGRHADEDGAASGARPRQGPAMSAIRSRSSSPRRSTRPRTPPRRSRSTTRCCPRWSIPRRRSEGAPQIHEVAPRNTIYQWHLGEPRRSRGRLQAAAHVTKLDLVNNRLVPNAMEPRAAIGEYDAGNGELHAWNTTQNPHVARLVLSAFVGIAPEHKLRVIAPDVGGGFGSKIFIYPEEIVCLWAAKKVGRPVKWIADRTEAFIADAHGRDHVTHAEMAFDADGKITALRGQDDRQSRRLHVDLLVVGADLSLCDAALGPVRHPAHLLRGRRGLHQHDAGRCLSRRRAPGSDLRGRAPRRGGGAPARHVDPAELRRKNFIKNFPHQTPVIMNYDAGDYDASLSKALELADVRAFRQAQARRPSATASCAGFGFSTYIEACGIAPSQAVGSLGAGVGLWESAEVRVNPTGTVEVLTGTPQPRPGPRDDVRAARRRAARRSDRERVESSMATPTRCSSAWAPTARAPAPSACRRSSRRSTRSRPRPRRSPRTCSRPAEADIVFKDGKFTVAGTDKSAAWGDVALHAYIAHKFTGAELEPGLKEGAFYDPTNFTFPAGCHICEVEIDPETGLDAASRAGRRSMISASSSIR